MNYEFDSFSSFLFIITAILVIINIAIIIAVLTGCGTDNTDNVEKTSPTTPKPTPNEPIDCRANTVRSGELVVVNCENCNQCEFAIGFDGIPYCTNCGETVNVEDNMLDVVLRPYLTR